MAFFAAACGPGTVGTTADGVHRHFSQFVDPGAKVVAATGGDSGAAKTSIVQAAGKKESFSMPATGWATVVLSP